MTATRLDKSKLLIIQCAAHNLAIRNLNLNQDNPIHHDQPDLTLDERTTAILTLDVRTTAILTLDERTPALSFRAFILSALKDPKDAEKNDEGKTSTHESQTDGSKDYAPV